MGRDSRSRKMVNGPSRNRDLIKYFKRLFASFRLFIIASVGAPAAIMMMSVAQKPYLFSLDVRAFDSTKKASDLQFLLRRDDFSVYYTGVDLLYPPRDAGYYQAVLFDLPVVPPETRNDPSANSLPLLRWITQIGQAVTLKDGLGNPISGMSPTERDNSISSEFVTGTYAAPIRLGDIFVHGLPNDASYVKFFGVRLFVALGVSTWPPTSPNPADQERSLYLNSAIEAALSECQKRGISGIAVPFIEIHSSPAGREDSWREILQTLVRNGSRYNVSTGVLGGRAFGLIQRGEERIDADFVAAFEQFARTMRLERPEAVHGALRLMVLANIAAVVRLLRRYRSPEWRKLALLFVGSASIALAVMKGYDWMSPIISLSRESGLTAQALGAAFAGYWLPEVMRLLKEEVT